MNVVPVLGGCSDFNPNAVLADGLTGSVRSALLKGSPLFPIRRTVPYYFTSLHLSRCNQITIQGFLYIADVHTKCQCVKNLQVSLFIINIVMRCNMVENVEHI